MTYVNIYIFVNRP